MPKKKIIIVDDEPLMSTLIKEIIDDDPVLEVSQITTKKDDFLNIVSKDHFDIALIDISMGSGKEGGLDVLSELKDKGLGMKVVMFSAHDELSYARKCLQDGADGYISKEAICSDLVKGLKEVVNGNLFVSGERGNDILEQYKKSSG